MFGWEEQVKLTDSIYKSLSPSDKEKTIILAGNYGEAGAIEIIGEKYNLPSPVCHSGSFWLWGSGKTSGEVCISIGNEKETIERLFNDYKLVKIIRHQYAIEEENGIPVYLCRNPKVSLKKIWPSLEQYIFD